MDVIVPIPPSVERVGIFGSSDRNLKMLREALGIRLTPDAHGLRLAGERDAVAAARAILDRLIIAARKGVGLTREQVLDLITDEAARARNGVHSPSDLARDLDAGGIVSWEGDLDVFVSGRRIGPRTPNQGAYLEAIRTHDLVLGIGPAGTGKTYLAVAAAVHLLKIQRVRRVLLVRPAVEAGEKLGYLPGALEEKVNPYLRPLLDALHDMLDPPTIRRFMESGVVEIVPLAYMRGRTLNGAVVLLDEAQNTTMTQMKMFLTRMGHGSKMIVTGDPTQTDLPEPASSGLIDAVRRLRRTAGVSAIALTRADIVRHTLVQRVLEAYGDDDEAHGGMEW